MRPASGRPPIERLRSEYPALARQVRGRTPIYFDSAATALKPRAVIDAVAGFLSENGANVHRGIHALSREASERYESARDAVAAFCGADAQETVFVRNTTEAVNLVAASLPPGSRVVLTGMEHHSNLLPWRARHRIETVPLEGDGTVAEEALLAAIVPGVDLVALCHVSNVFGVVNPVSRVVQRAKEAGARVLVDGAQAVPHMPVDVKEIGCDFYAFSAHKLGGPTGIGALYAARSALAELKPLLWGGNMVSAVHLSGETLHDGPLRLEAGTPAVEGAIGFAAACEFLEDAGLDAVWEHGRRLRAHARRVLARIARARLHGPEDPERAAAIASFSIAGIPANMVAKVLSDRASVYVRSGWLCSQPLHEALGLEPTVRASFYLYNTEEEIDTMASVLEDLAATA